MPKIRGFWALVLSVLLLPLTASAGGGIPLAQDLAAEGAAAAAEGKPLLVMFSAEGCPYCEVVEGEHLMPRIEGGDFDGRVTVRKIMIDSFAPITGFAGQATDGHTVARDYGIHFAPVVVFFDDQGEELAKRLVGAGTPDFYGAYLNNRIERARHSLTGSDQLAAR